MITPVISRRVAALLFTGLASTALLLNAQTQTQQQKPAVVPAEKQAEQPKGLQLKDGDRFIFIGDSITHQCLYTQFVENFFYTRYPQKRLHFRNAGISGDRARDVLNRFDEDIAAFKPTVATILLGMNDGAYKDFDQALFDTYAKDMTELMDRLDAMKVRIIILSPTMFDHQAWDDTVKQKPDYAKGRVPTNYNAVLAYYGRWLQDVALNRGYDFVDMYSPLNNLTVQQRKTNPKFTLVADAIHPGTDGQFVMAYSILQQLGETGPVLNAGVEVVDGQWKTFTPSVVSDLKGNPNRSVSYTVKPQALPWTEFSDAPTGTRLTRAGHSATRESHAVIGLESRRYELRINGKAVSIFNERALANHAEIQDDPDSPTYQQAMRVIELNKKRNKEAVNPLRGLWGRQKSMLGKKDSDPAAYDTWRKEFEPKRAELDALAAKYEAEVYQINKPQPLKVEIIPAPPVVKEVPNSQPNPSAPAAKPAEPAKKAA